MDLIYGYYVFKENGLVLIDIKPELPSNIDNRQHSSRGGIGLMPINNGYNSDNYPALFFVDYSKQICNGSQ